MPDQSLPRRAHYMRAVMSALKALGGAADLPDIYRWIEDQGLAKPEDVATHNQTGGSRFAKHVLFGRMMLVRAGLVVIPQRGHWVLTEAGRQLDLTPQLAAQLYEAVDRIRSGTLNPERTYQAILQAARRGEFITYGDLAKASDVDWSKARHPLPLLLGRLVLLARVRGWPLLSAIVVNKEERETGALVDSGLEGFLKAARDVGLDPGDNPEAFVRDQQRQVFAWAKDAPDRLGILGRKDSVAPDPEEDEDDMFPETDPKPIDLMETGSGLIDPDALAGRRYWFGGAMWDNVDQTPRFLAEGIWQNGYEDQFSDLVRRMAPGDRIAIKSAFVQKLRLPFDAGGAKVSVMRIKATGTVIGNVGDGLTVEVAWDPPAPPRDWYFYTYMKTLHEADQTIEQGRHLIAFTFSGALQNYDWWLEQPYFARKYGKGRAALPPAALTAAEPPVVVAEPAGYFVDDIVTDGCFLDPDALDDILARLGSKKNLILQGPPGTGKTWLAKRLGYALLGTNDNEVVRARMRVVQFHPSLAYEDFVRGWRPVNGKLELADGVFLQAIDAALSEPGPFVLVIEEINRGNPAQVLGEMLTLLEDSKRRPEEGVELAYPRDKPGGERVHIPENLYVIGTMNVADRSLALVDLALRRRFAFVSLEPRLGAAWRDWSGRKGLQTAVADLIEARLGVLNDMIGKDRALGPQFRVGHSYVTPTAPVGADGGYGWFRSVVETEIMPLLEEYWYDQPDKVEDARTALLPDLA